MSNPYQPNPYGGYAQPHPQGTTVLVLGILGLVLCPIVAIVGWVQGTRALREIDANPQAYNNRQNVSIGRILSMVGVGLWVLIIAFYLLLFVVLGVLGTQS